MLTYPRGQISFVCGMLLLIGHFLSFVLVWGNSAISPVAKSDIIAIIVPITVASVTSAVLYAAKHAEMDLKATPPVNAFFLTVAIIIPLGFFAVLFWGLYSLDGERAVDDFKLFIVTAEAMFGGIFVVVTEALFSSPHPVDGSSVSIGGTSNEPENPNSP
jgi:hypothetical protein